MTEDPQVEYSLKVCANFRLSDRKIVEYLKSTANKLLKILCLSKKEGKKVVRQDQSYDEYEEYL